MIGAKHLHISFDKVDEFIRVYDGTKCLVLFGPENMLLFTKGLNILQVKNLVLQMFFLITIQESNLIYMIIYL